MHNLLLLECKVHVM